jgi:hypothetical protein
MNLAPSYAQKMPTFRCSVFTIGRAWVPTELASLSNLLEVLLEPIFTRIWGRRTEGSDVIP